MLLLRDLPQYETLKAKARRYPDLDVSAVASCLALLRVATDVFNTVSSNLAHRGMSQGRLTVLGLLDREPEKAACAGDLAARAGVTPATMTGLLDGLQRDGLIRRETAPEDRRSLAIRLTSKGRRLLDRMCPVHFRMIAKLMSSLSQAERKTLMALLSKLREGLPATTRPRVRRTA